MIEFTKTIDIGRPIDEVFCFVADLENTPLWNEDVVRSKKMTPGPVGAGTAFRQYRATPGATAEAVAVSTHVPGQLLEIEGRIANHPAHLVYRFDQMGGATRLSNTVEVNLIGAVRLLAPSMETRLAHGIADNLAELKRVLEAA